MLTGRRRIEDQIVYGISRPTGRASGGKLPLERALCADVRNRQAVSGRSGLRSRGF